MTRDAALEILSDCRKRIDEIDLRILALLNERTMIVQKIGEAKQSAKMPIYEPRREDQVFQNVTSNNTGPLTSEAVKGVFERIVDEMRKVQRERMERENS